MQWRSSVINQEDQLVARALVEVSGGPGRRAHDARRQAAPDHRRDHPRLDRLRGRAAGAARRRRDRADRLRPRPADDRAGGQGPAVAGRRARARRQPAGGPRGPRRHARRTLGRRRRRPPRDRLRARRRARRRLPHHAARERDHRVPDQRLLAEGARRRPAAAARARRRRRQRRRPRLRRHRRLAGLRLDGGGQGALESVSRYLARDLGPRGIRVNLVSAGPLETLAAGGIPGFDELARFWREPGAARLGRQGPGPVADAACFLLSPLARGITGEIIHVDGGFHAMGAPLR